MKRILMLGCCLSAGFLIGLAQSAGTYAFLRNDVSARAGALNGSFVSMTNDPNILFYNPAGLTTVENPSGSVGFLKHVMDVNAGNISFAQYAEGIGSVGVGITFISYGTFTETDGFLNNLGNFGATEFAIVGGVATPLDEESSVGANIKIISSSIASYSSSAVAIDLGYLYFIPAENITIGASILNLGRQLKTYAGVRESLPFDVKIGITKRPEHLPVFLNLNFHKLNESQETLLQRLSSFSFGAEFLMSESVRFRVGYNNEQRKDLKLGTSSGLAGFSLGGGILSGDYRFDYAFNSYGKIGALHRFSLGTTF
ncbi:MAG: type IX secretion system protein PorQ [Ignavibacteriales bacterium]|nr:type IX secretion system protein PorQ [Ignavibacteriales bacterium]